MQAICLRPSALRFDSLRSVPVRTRACERLFGWLPIPDSFLALGEFILRSALTWQMGGMVHSLGMATYIYETTDPTKPVRHFELQQSMKDEPLTRHPETGEAIRRVITGGFGYMSSGNSPRHADMQRSMGGGGGGSCGSGCGCH